MSNRHGLVVYGHGYVHIRTLGTEQYKRDGSLTLKVDERQRGREAERLRGRGAEGLRGYFSMLR